MYFITGVTFQTKPKYKQYTHYLQLFMTLDTQSYLFHMFFHQAKASHQLGKHKSGHGYSTDKDGYTLH